MWKVNLAKLISTVIQSIADEASGWSIHLSLLLNQRSLFPALRPQTLFMLLCIFHEKSFRKTWHCALSYSLFPLCSTCIANLFMWVFVVSQVVFLWLSKVPWELLQSQARPGLGDTDKVLVLIFFSVLTMLDMHLFTYLLQTFFFF